MIARKEKDANFEHLPREELASFMQSAKLMPNITRDEIIAHIEECAQYKFNAAAVAMCWVPLARDILRGTGVRVVTFFGFGMGNESLNAKLALINEAQSLGADEVDYTLVWFSKPGIKVPAEYAKRVEEMKKK